LRISSTKSGKKPPFAVWVFDLKSGEPALTCRHLLLLFYGWVIIAFTPQLEKAIKNA
jgi:hypothetical protein